MTTERPGYRASVEGMWGGRSPRPSRPNPGGMKDAHATDSDIHYCDGGGRGESGSYLSKRAPLPMASKKTQEEKVGTREACVHPYVLWWNGSCLGCRKTPLPPSAIAKYKAMNASAKMRGERNTTFRGGDMTEQMPMPDGWVGQEATITYRERADHATGRNCTIREVNDRGVGVEEGQKTSFFPWTSIVRIDLGHHARRGSRKTRFVD